MKQNSIRILFNTDIPTGEGGAPSAENPSGDQKPKRAIEDDILSALAEDLEIVISDEKKADEPPKAPEIKPVGEEKPQDKPEEKPKVGVKVKEDVSKTVESVFEKKLAEFRAAMPTPPQPPAETGKKDEEQPKADDSNLTQEQLEELRDAAYAAKVDPKWRGLEEKIRAFNSKLEQYAAEALEKDPERTLDENDPEFIAWVKANKPWSAKDRDVVRIERIADEKAEAKIRERLEGRLEKAEAAAREAKFQPVIERTVQKLISEFDAENKSDDPLEEKVISETKAAAEQLATDYLRLVNGVDSWGSHNPSDLQERHKWLQNFVVAQGEVFSKHGGDKRIRGGRTFVTPSKYAELRSKNDPELAKTWTFTSDDILHALRAHATAVAKQRVKAIEEENAKLGFVRAKKSSEAKQEEEPKPVSGPKATSTPAPGALDTSANKGVKTPGQEIIEILGLAD